jgi:hypothetical protein
MATPAKVDWRKFGNYSGPYIAPAPACYVLPTGADHLDRAFWLTTCVESGKGPTALDGGKFGTWNAYDGCAGTGGLHQGIAVYPKEIADPDNNPEDDQGELFEMIRQIALATHSDGQYKAKSPVLKYNEDIVALYAAYKALGWYLAEDGKLRDLQTGKAIAGKVIRDTFTPLGGATPAKGPRWDQAVQWAKLHRAVFANPLSYDVQVSFGVNSKARFCTIKRPQLGKISINAAVYKSTVHESPGAFSSLGAHDLAMCVFFSHSVNAPGIALQKLAVALKQVKGDAQHSKFPILLIRDLNCKYGRWDDDIPGGRYQRTRDAAMKLWPRELFEGSQAVMPKDILD